MPLPETIPVKYTEEEAEYLSMRPVVRQTFRTAELVDMILRVAGKDAQRISQILRSGTIVYHSYRYWWQGFDADPASLAEILVNYPDADPSRMFRPEECSEILLESSGSPARHSLRIRCEEATAKRLLRFRSLWECLMERARQRTPAYREYSYSLSGDIYELALSAEESARLRKEAEELSAHGLRTQLRHLPAISRIVFLCPRPAASKSYSRSAPA